MLTEAGEIIVCEMDSDLTGLVPAEWWPLLDDAARSDPTFVKYREAVPFAPLPRLATYFYVAAGCWQLARELQRISGAPLGAKFDPWGRALLVFIVDGADIVDAIGRRLLATKIEEAAAVGCEIETAVELEDVVATLREPGLGQVRRMLGSPAHRADAARAAKIVAAATGLAECAASRP